MGRGAGALVARGRPGPVDPVLRTRRGGRGAPRAPIGDPRQAGGDRLPHEGGGRSGATRKAPEKASERLRRLLTVVPYLVRHQGTRVAEVARSVRDVRARAPGRPGPAVRLGAAAVRPGRPDRRRHPGRPHLDRDGRLLRPAAAPHAERGARHLPAGHRAGRGSRASQEAPALASALGKLRRARSARRRSASCPSGWSSAADGRTAGDARRAPSRGHGPRASADRVLRGVGGPRPPTARSTPRRSSSRSGTGTWRRGTTARRPSGCSGRTGSTPRRRRGSGSTPADSGAPGRPCTRRRRATSASPSACGPTARWVAEYYETSREQELGDGRLEVELPAGRLEWVERLLLRLWGRRRGRRALPSLNDRVRELAGRTRQDWYG